MLLPTLNVTDAQAERVRAAYGSAEACKEWLKRGVIAFVSRAEARADMKTRNDILAAKRREVEDDLGGVT